MSRRSRVIGGATLNSIRVPPAFASYQFPGSNGEFDVYSLGADAAVGGTGEAADIGNWNLDS